ncbi:hypothetical protein [Phenylobacterium sp.]|jgi:hypothetical protein|uniref:hypothetical protein n=1 Tax=Phenylobacterium sp. TaxID=1871053 RepID=UPI0035AD8A0D
MSTQKPPAADDERAAADRQAETERAAPQPAAEELDPEALKRARQEAAAKRSQ